jgi:hypothetical protein
MSPPFASLSELHILLANTKLRLSEKFGWTASFTNDAVNEYYIFLYMHYSYPKVNLVPGKVIDEIWHDHILHTSDYNDFCQIYFGSFFHHAPRDRLSNRVIDIEPTLELYKVMYDRPAPKVFWLEDEHVKCRTCRYTNDPIKYFISPSIRSSSKSESTTSSGSSTTKKLTMWECG